MTDPKMEEIRDPRKHAQGYIDAFTSLGMGAEQSELTWTLEALLTKLDEAEKELGDVTRTLGGTETYLRKVRTRILRGEKRERVLIAGIREALEYLDQNDGHNAVHGVAHAILSRLLPSTPTEEGNDDE